MLNPLNPIITALIDIRHLLFLALTIPDHCLEVMPTPQFEQGRKSTAEIFSQAMLDIKMIEYTYNIAAPEEQPNFMKSTLRNSFENQLLSHGIMHYKTTYEILTAEENTRDLQGCIFLDPVNKIIIVAFAGTRLESTTQNILMDLWDDVLITCGSTTMKTDAIMRLNDHILTEFQAQIRGGWALHYTGHSSGAHNADFAANHMCGLRDYLTAQDFEDKIQNRIGFEKDQISITSFESAGGVTPLKNAAAICGYKIIDQDDQRLFEGGYNIFNARENFINSIDRKSNAQLFKVEHDDHGPNRWWQFWKTLHEHDSTNFIKVFEGDGYIVKPDGKITTYTHNKIEDEALDFIIEPDYDITRQDTDSACEMLENLMLADDSASMHGE